MPHLHIPRLISFTLTTLLCNATAGLGIWGLIVGKDNKAKARRQLPGSTLHIDDIINSGAAVTAAAGFASILCCILALLALLHHHRHLPQPPFDLLAKTLAFGFALLFFLATLIPFTLFAATRSATITLPGMADAVVKKLVEGSGERLEYAEIRAVVAQSVVGWIAFLATLITFVLVVIEARHTLANGPDSALLEVKGDKVTSIDGKPEEDQSEKGGRV